MPGSHLPGLLTGSFGRGTARILPRRLGSRARAQGGRTRSLGPWTCLCRLARRRDRRHSSTCGENASTAGRRGAAGRLRRRCRRPIACSLRRWTDRPPARRTVTRSGGRALGGPARRRRNRSARKRAGHRERCRRPGSALPGSARLSARSRAASTAVPHGRARSRRRHCPASPGFRLRCRSRHSAGCRTRTQLCSGARPGAHPVATRHHTAAPTHAAAGVRPWVLRARRRPRRARPRDSGPRAA